MSPRAGAAGIRCPLRDLEYRADDVAALNVLAQRRAARYARSMPPRYARLGRALSRLIGRPRPAPRGPSELERVIAARIGSEIERRVTDAILARLQ
jgi:hypothetical protein